MRAMPFSVDQLPSKPHRSGSVWTFLTGNSSLLLQNWDCELKSALKEHTVPAPDRMLTHLHQAIALVRATPGRRGHVVHLPDCTEVLVAGDLHGRVPNFQ